MAPMLIEVEQGSRLDRRDRAGGNLWYNSRHWTSAMKQSANLLTLQFLLWVADRPRTRADVLEAWHSCPRTSVWEDCVVGGLVRFENGDKTVSLTARGRAVLTGGGAGGPDSPTRQGG